MRYKLEELLNNVWVRNFLIPILLITPILWFALPLIHLGTDNLRMIVHFDNDEATLVQFAAKTYSHGLVPLEVHAAFPQLFYYIAGIFLYPYTFFMGLNYQVITIIFRSLNLIAGLLSVIFLYFFCQRFFKSTFVAILSCVLFATTPEYLWWLVNSRPHPFEILLILISLYFCLTLIEEFKPKYMLGAILFAGLAAATKYGGIFLVPVIWMTYVYHLFSFSGPRLIEYLKNKYKLINVVASIIVLSVVLIFSTGAYVLFKYQRLFHRNSIKSVHEFLQIRDVRIFILCLGLLLLVAIGWLIINALTRRLAVSNGMGAKHRYMFIINFSLLFLFCIVGSIAVIFAVFDPPYWIFPIVSGKAIATNLMMTAMGTTMNAAALGMDKPIFDLGRLVWFKMIFDSQLLGLWIGLCFFFYFAYETFAFKNNWSKNQSFVLQRSLLWIYAIVLFLTLVLVVSHRPHHYLLPICIVMMILTSFGVTQVIRESKTKTSALAFLILFIILLGLGFYARGNKIIEQRQLKLSKANDVVLVIGDWLAENYSENKIIWKDNDVFYVPPKFKYVNFPNKVNYNIIEGVKENDPDILIIVDAWDPKLAHSRAIDQAIYSGKIRGFRQVKRFKYNGFLSLGPTDFNSGKEIFIYSKNR